VARKISAQVNRRACDLTATFLHDDKIVFINGTFGTVEPPVIVAQQRSEERRVLVFNLFGGTRYESANCKNQKHGVSEL
jgi:hypothetical protein